MFASLLGHVDFILNLHGVTFNQPVLSFPFLTKYTRKNTTATAAETAIIPKIRPMLKVK